MTATVLEFPRRRHVHCEHCDAWQPSEAARAAHVRWDCPALRDTDDAPDGAA